jgi:RNA polymerase sigma-70 factor (ECF subfamily)
MTEISDLVKLLKQGDENAFNTLVNQYKTYAYSVAYNRVGNFTDAEEIAQMAFIEVYKHIKELKEPEKLLNWLHGITDRVSLNWLRKYRKQRIVSLNERSDDIADKDDKPLDKMVKDEESTMQENEAMKVYKSLEPEYQQVLTLKYMEELSYDEIAERLGVTKDIVRGRLYRAHQTLRRVAK